MPYANLPKDAFWKLTLEDEGHCLDALYRPKVPLVTGMRVSTAGSCFAQHFRRFVLRSDLHYVDMEPPPAGLPEDVAQQHGYSAFSARFANIYTSRQLLQLLQDAQAGTLRDPAIWEDQGRWFDGLRPNVEPQGFETRQELELHRLSHLRRVLEMVVQSDVFVFTLGLTECWQDVASGTVFPMAPGTVAGSFDPDQHGFLNLGIADVIEDLYGAIDILRSINPDLNIILTVSQIITNPMFKSQFFAPNMRSVTEAGVNTVMSTVFGAHPGVWLQDAANPDLARTTPEQAPTDDDLICEEILLEEFARK